MSADLESVASLDPQIRAYIDAAAPTAFPDGARFGDADADAYLRRQRAVSWTASEPATATVRITESHTPSRIPVRVYVPSAQARRLVVYFHGGGWVVGDLNMQDGLCRRIADTVHAAVVSVGYRLAPEHPYPAPFEDAVEATRWAIDSASQWGVDASNTVIAGSSAGANLAAAVALHRRDHESQPPLTAQLLIYPVLDSSMSTPSYEAKARGFLLSRDQLRFYWDAYVQDRSSRTEAYASPTHADSVANLPPAVVVAAEHDPLRDEAEAYAARLRDEGRLIELIHVDGQVHGFFAAFPDSPAALMTLSRVADALDGA